MASFTCTALEQHYCLNMPPFLLLHFEVSWSWFYFIFYHCQSNRKGCPNIGLCWLWLIKLVKAFSFEPISIIPLLIIVGVVSSYIKRGQPSENSSSKKSHFLARSVSLLQLIESAQKSEYSTLRYNQNTFCVPRYKYLGLPVFLLGNSLHKKFINFANYMCSHFNWLHAEDSNVFISLCGSPTTTIKQL